MRFLALLASLVLLFPVLVLAQDGSPANPEEAAKAAAERRADQFLRGLRTLELNEGQTSQIRALVLAAELANEQQRAARTAAVEELLDDAQKTKYHELQAARAQRGQGGQRGPGAPGAPGAPGEKGGRAGGLLGRFGLSADAIAERVGASAELKERIAAAIAEWQEALRAAFKGGDRDQMRAAMREQISAIRERISGLLDEGQKAKFAELIAGLDARQGGGSGPATPRGGDSERPAADPEQQVKRRLDEAMKALSLSSEEAAVMSPLVEKLVRHNTATARVLREQRDEIAALAGDANADMSALEGKITSLALFQEQSTALREKLQAGLRELLTRTQEFRLVGLGLLPPVSVTSATEPPAREPNDGMSGEPPAEK